MKEKTRKIFIMIVMAALIVSLMAASFAALTYGRYSGGKFDENSPYDDYIDFVGATAYEVRTPEQFVNAINNGYSYIKIAADAEEPFVVNNDIANVYTNLVIDVNGKTVIRNSRNPVLDVRRNISVVLVYDSSEKAKGGFYNPVGSALQTSGGTLTVGAGVYKSGPNVEAVKSVTTAEISDVFDRVGDRASATAYYKKADSVVLLPKLGEDVYLGETYSGTKNDYLKPDTYLIYTKENNCYVKDGQLLVNCTKTGTEISGTSFRVESNVASCDFYYYYPVGTANEDGFQTYAVVYGYNDVKALAKTKNENLTSGNETNLVWPYAAIRSEAGNTHARGGKFYTYFGEENTYSIYSEGGTMTVGSAGSSSAAGPAFEAVGEGVCIRSQTTGAAVGSSDAASLEISGGSFSSEIGDTIQMEGGAVKITGGTFAKNGSKARPSGTLDEIEASRTALVHMRGGDLTIDGTVTDANYSVTMAAGSEQTPLTNVFGIYSEQSSSGDSGTVTVSGCDISVNGTYSAGVLSSAGTVNVGGAENGKAQTKITVAESIKDGLLTSSAVSSEGGTVNLRNTVIITSDSLGITARGTVNVNGGATTVTTPNATGVYVNNGTLNVDAGATLGVESTVNADLKWVTPPESSGSSDPVTQIYNGVFVHGGSLVSEGALNVTFTGVENEESGTYLDQQIKSYAVRVEAAASGSDTEVSIAGGEISNSVGGGVYVGGGAVTLGKQETTNGVTTYSGPTVQTTGNLLYANRTYWDRWNWSYVVSSPQSWQYMLNKSGGHAVEVSGGSLTVHGGNYTAQQGNGILIRNTSDDRTTNTVKINSGSFVGYNSGYYIEYDGRPPLGTERMVGPAASYGLNVMGHDLDVTINGGEFGNNKGDVGNSAASFFGTPVEGTSDEIEESKPTVAVHGGTFNANNADAISVFRFIDITFDDTASQISSNISNGAVASLSVQDDLLYTGYMERGSTIAIQSGTFTGTAYGIWYACGYDKLSISGDATIEGSTGLQVASAPVENGIAISGGTIEGGTEGIYYNASASVEGEGYGLKITGGTIRGTGNNKNGHALNIVVKPKKHAIHIGDSAQLFGGRDAIYVNNADGDKNAVSITGGTFTGAEKDTAGDYGCAIWFNSGMDDSVYQITGGKFITKKGGSAIWTSNPAWHYLWQIFPEGCLINGSSYDRNYNFDTTIKGMSEITVSRS